MKSIEESMEDDGGFEEPKRQNVYMK